MREGGREGIHNFKGSCMVEVDHQGKRENMEHQKLTIHLISFINPLLNSEWIETLVPLPIIQPDDLLGLHTFPANLGMQGTNELLNMTFNVV